MRDFGKYTPHLVLEHHFELEPKWWFRLRPPTSADDIALEAFIREPRVLVWPDGRREMAEALEWEIAHREIAILFVETNLPLDENKPVEEGGEPVLPKNAPVEQVESWLKAMPPQMVNELWRAVAELNPGGTWGPEPAKGKKGPDAKATPKQ